MKTYYFTLPITLRFTLKAKTIHAALDKAKETQNWIKKFGTIFNPCDSGVNIGLDVSEKLPKIEDVQR